MTDVLIDRPELESLGTYEFGWADSDAAGASARRGVSPEVVADISGLKQEPEWMLQRRQRALQLFERKPMPTWGADLSEIDFDNIKYFVRSTEKQAQTWEDLPDDIKNTYERSASPRPSASVSSRASQPSTSPRWSTTRSTKSSSARASSSWTPTRR